MISRLPTMTFRGRGSIRDVRASVGTTPPPARPRAAGGAWSPIQPSGESPRGEPVHVRARRYAVVRRGPARGRATTWPSRSIADPETFTTKTCSAAAGLPPISSVPSLATRAHGAGKGVRRRVSRGRSTPLRSRFQLSRLGAEERDSSRGAQDSGPGPKSERSSQSGVVGAERPGADHVVDEAVGCVDRTAPDDEA